MLKNDSTEKGNKRTNLKLQDIYDSYEEFWKANNDYGLMLTINEERLNLNLPVYTSIEKAWKDNPTLSMTNNRDDLTIMHKGKRPIVWED
jgi:hypothetical protein